MTGALTRPWTLGQTPVIRRISIGGLSQCQLAYGNAKKSASSPLCSQVRLRFMKHIFILVLQLHEEDSKLCSAGCRQGTGKHERTRPPQVAAMLDFRDI